MTRKIVKRSTFVLESDPLLYKGSIVKEKSSEKWLGDFINGAGVKESTLTTIKERKFRIMCIINETISIIEDSRMHKLNGMKCAVNIWELAIVPALLNNGCAWSVLDKRVQQELEYFQSHMLRGLLAVHKLVPRPALTYEADLTLMKFRLYARVLNFMKHVHC